MHDYEKLGVFYLGRTVDADTRTVTHEPLLYASKQLTTHAVVLGMTGSGKTGLSIGLVEEAAIDGIPVLAIDPKGDLANLLLTFPDLRPDDFRPWVDEEEAGRKGQTADEFAAETAATWRKGLSDWDQDAARIQRLRDAADVVVYTPGSRAGTPLALLRSFAAPPAGLDDEARRERLDAAVVGLLGLLGIHADPMQDREPILLARILDAAWSEGREVGLADLVLAIQKPPFERVGVVDIEAFFPAKERTALAMRLNNLLASPQAAAWMEGEPLDVGRMLASPGGKPRIAIVSIAHLTDEQRMFFVATLLHEVVGWMRAQTGTSSLRAVLFMDEIYGYFPPSANPPTKPPMLTLLKQARAFGLGVVLATQNPVDLDYKGLANCGAWFIGRLQTERDKARVLDGLEGAASSSGKGIDRAAMDTLLSGLGNRTFLLNNVYAEGPVLFQSRWTLSYLRGPMTREELKRFAAVRSPSGAPTASPRKPLAAAGRPSIPVGMDERFFGEGAAYEPYLYASARVHYVDAKAKVDQWEDVAVLAPFTDDERLVAWSQVVPAPAASKAPNEGATFAALPSQVGRKSAAAEWKKAFAAWIYQERAGNMLRCDALGLASTAGETEGEFRTRLAHAGRERRDAAVSELQAKYGPKIAAANDKVQKAEAKLAKEKTQATTATVTAAMSWGSALIGALFGGRSLTSSVSKVATATRSTGRTLDQRSDVGQAEVGLDAAQQAVVDLTAELETAMAKVAAETSPDTLTVRALTIPARKADTQVLGVALAWKSVDG